MRQARKEVNVSEKRYASTRAEAMGGKWGIRARGIEQAVRGPAPAQEFTHATSTYLHHFHGHTTSISRVSFTNPLITLLTALLPCAQVSGRALPSLKPRQLYDGYATPAALAAAGGGSDSAEQNGVHGIYKHCNLFPLPNCSLHWQERQ